MACVNDDGSLTASAKSVLEVLKNPATDEELAPLVGQPLFKVRSSLREMEDAGLVAREGEKYRVTPEGAARLS